MEAVKYLHTPLSNCGGGGGGGGGGGRQVAAVAAAGDDAVAACTPRSKVGEGSVQR